MSTIDCILAIIGMATIGILITLLVVVTTGLIDEVPEKEGE